MAPRNIRPEQARALRLYAQHLTDDTVAPDLVSAAAAGLQDTPPGSAALGLFARTSSATPAAVRSALADDRSLVIVWGRRGSPHLVPSSEIGMFTRGLLPDDEESWRTTIAGFVAHLDSVGMTAGELVGLVAEAIHTALDGRELTKRELGEAIRPLMPVSMRAFFEPETFSRFSATLARAASLYGGFVLAPRHGHEASFVRTDQWLGQAPADDPAEAGEAMVRRYLTVLGPSLPRSFATWAGIGEGHARRLFDLVADDLVAVRVDGADGFVLAEDAERLDSLERPESVRLLPPYDPYLSAIDRRVIVPDSARHKRLWKAQGDPGAVLVGDEIAAAWRAKVDGKFLSVEVTEFRTLSKPARAAIEKTASRMTPFKGARHARVRFV